MWKYCNIKNSRVQNRRLCPRTSSAAPAVRGHGRHVVSPLSSLYIIALLCSDTRGIAVLLNCRMFCFPTALLLLGAITVARGDMVPLQATPPEVQLPQIHNE
ncbi:hypothetical protein Y032_0015g2868 [Ancylostoma ceylanicum]|uniref:Uncharacterized protein n=1 Tax=Ancylostoma ceylanicum TaxID=53326 RepID=A0A016V9Z9_9BILA|nr:hypothetical protein Y032_0015g2868 [Ancylostoma ceylanicum]